MQTHRYRTGSFTAARLRRLENSTRVTLDAAAIEYSEARKLLDGVSLVDAARSMHAITGAASTQAVADAVDEMIAAKETNGVSELYLADLRYRLGAFKDAFHCDVNALVPDDVARFFDRMKLAPRSYNNFLAGA